MTLFRMMLSGFLVAMLCACGNADGPAEQKSTTPVASAVPARQFKIALVMKTLINPYFAGIEKGARRAQQEFGVDLQVKAGSQETAMEQQIQIVEELIDLKVDAIVISPGDSKRPIPILKKAQNAGIVIITIDNALDPETMAQNKMQPVPLVSVDNELASYKVARQISQSISKPTKAAVMGGISNAENSQQRIHGALRAFAENRAIQVVDNDTANWRIDEAHNLAKRFFTAHPDIKLVFCANDMMALGTIQYLQESGRKNVTVIGYDAIDEARKAVLAGTLAATVDQQATEQGYQGVALAVRALKGEKLPETVLVNAQVMTPDSLR